MRRTNQHGLSLIEMAIYVAIVGIIASVLAGLFAAGEKSYTYAWRQTSVLMWARQALEGGAYPHGMIWEGRQAQQVTALSAASLALTTPDAAAPQFTLSGTTLNTIQKSVTEPVALHVTGLQLSYYNLDNAGHIIVSTTAAAATLVTTQVQMQGIRNKTYTFYTGVKLRNHS